MSETNKNLPSFKVSFTHDAWADIVSHANKLDLEPNEFLKRALGTYFFLMTQFDRYGDGEVRFYEPKTWKTWGQRFYSTTNLKNVMGLEKNE